VSIRIVLVRGLDRKPEAQRDDGRTHNVAQGLNAICN
jgi:hypothetical protein